MDYKEETCLCNWMQILRNEIGNVPLNRILIPGAHDSNTYSIQKVKALSAFARCQGNSLYSQLCSGIRFFDIRVGDFASAELKEVINKEREVLRKIHNKEDSAIKSGIANSHSTLSKKEKLSTINLFTTKNKKLFENRKILKNKQKIKIIQKIKKTLLEKPKSKAQNNSVDWGKSLSEMVEDYSQKNEEQSSKNSFELDNNIDRSRISLWDDYQNKSIFGLTNLKNQKDKAIKPTKYNKNKNNFLLINKSPNIDLTFANRRRQKKTVHISKSARILSNC
jgi:succinate dehydrogenase flavin-adding protein (antitoxin of CptAB toxin-antitoxin module)